MQVNGRGQVALRVALMRGNERDPSDPWLFDPFSRGSLGSSDRGFRAEPLTHGC